MRAFKLKPRSAVLVLRETSTAVESADDTFAACYVGPHVLRFSEEHLVLDPQGCIDPDHAIDCTDPAFAGDYVHADLLFCRYGWAIGCPMPVHTGQETKCLPVGTVVFAHWDDVEIADY